MSEHPTEEQWMQAIKVDNLLQKKSPATATRQAYLIRKRLDILNQEAWELIAQSEQEIAIELLLASAIKHSHLFLSYKRGDSINSYLGNSEYGF